LNEYGDPDTGIPGYQPDCPVQIAAVMGSSRPLAISFCPDFKFLPLLSRFAAAKHKYDSGKYHAQANGQRTLQELSKYYLAK
jgi:hypothetical protein